MRQVAIVDRGYRSLLGMLQSPRMVAIKKFH